MTPSAAGWAWTVPCTQVNLQLGVREHTVHQETDHVHEPDGPWCALLVFAEFGKRPDLLFLMSADCTVRELQSLNGAVQTRMQVATRTILPDITRLAEKHHRFFLVERLCECSSCVRICLSIGTVDLGLQLTPCFFLFYAARHPADFDGRPTAGAQVLAPVSLIPRYPYHSGPALHSRVPSRPVSS